MLFSSSLDNLSEFDYKEDSLVEFYYAGRHTKWKNSNNVWGTDCFRINYRSNRFSVIYSSIM